MHVDALEVGVFAADSGETSPRCSSNKESLEAEAKAGVLRGADGFASRKVVFARVSGAIRAGQQEQYGDGLPGGVERVNV